MNFVLLLLLLLLLLSLLLFLWVISAKNFNQREKFSQK